jgi:hypothetical protein
MPAKTAMFVSMLRNREQFDRLVNSKAFARIKELPIVQQAMQKMHEQWEEEPNFEPIREFLASSENRQLKEVIVDALSHEIFFGASEEIGVWLEVLNEVNQAMNAAQFQAIAGADPQELIATKVVEVLEKNISRMKMPEEYFGFRITNAAAAKAELARLKGLLQKLIEEHAPQLADRFEEKKIGEFQYLTLRLDGSLIPWDELPTDEIPIDEDRIQKLIAEAKTKTLTVCLGVRDNYLILTSGPDEQHLQQLGQGPLLIDHQKMSPVAKADGKKVASISFVSDELMKELGSGDRQIDQFVDMAKAFLPLSPLPDELKEKLSRDAEELGKDVKQFLPKPGAASAYSFLTDTGYEGYSYSWTTNEFLDGSKRLSILNHVGGHPIFYYATRAKQLPAAYEFQGKWSSRLAAHAEELAMLYADDEQKELLEKAKKELVPILKQLQETNRTKWMPAFADGQSAIVLDAKLTAQQWHQAMPQSDNPLPLPELAFVFGVSDANLLKEAGNEYFEAVSTAMVKLNEIYPEKIPPIQIPRPQMRDVTTGQLYFYPLPPAAGLSDKIAPNAGLSQDTFVVSLVPEATERMLKSTSLDIEGPLKSHDGPLATAWHLGFGDLMKTAHPWVEYGFRIAAEQGQADEEVTSQILTVLEVLQCFEAVSGVSYMEDDAITTHFEWRFHDL